MNVEFDHWAMKSRDCITMPYGYESLNFMGLIGWQMDTHGDACHLYGEAIQSISMDNYYLLEKLDSFITIK